MAKTGTRVNRLPGLAVSALCCFSLSLTDTIREQVVLRPTLPPLGDRTHSLSIFPTLANNSCSPFDGNNTTCYLSQVMLTHTLRAHNAVDARRAAVHQRDLCSQRRFEEPVVYLHLRRDRDILDYSSRQCRVF
ncbi:hypothetical protein SCLCIDRAFT_285498 [Scleroderma citrinum Foug A]|uniref:Secreted protein n=1 Tax=Scleroderma citrinum Foug A TaxID=1036808 RepID=A0A0C2ZT42_9AGAM|nr:hypothetical protein SCLCIDRAFT_285498 [Scleroderma citrinum Foug A]